MAQLMAAGGINVEAEFAAITARLEMPVIAKAAPFKEPIEHEIDPFPAPNEHDEESPRERRGEPVRREEEEPEKVGS
ncbi:hypothetical protein CDO52_02870 [Nocardiopsis gilva YIM 90087]|uniref:Uncharacterized protein n=1 Tax=Nocardiopsis gilva YIM 90087 TaxID=1235441 RepID=A0A223S173_9ACTN|nr:hypothetical protein [Nocardiopsis gilva]ASU81870.1 hypothetical protein CDO52_02870 [Nocardiopsis gilva YIM 90087]